GRTIRLGKQNAHEALSVQDGSFAHGLVVTLPELLESHFLPDGSLVGDPVQDVLHVIKTVILDLHWHASLADDDTATRPGSSGFPSLRPAPTRHEGALPGRRPGGTASRMP